VTCGSRKRESKYPMRKMVLNKEEQEKHGMERDQLKRVVQVKVCDC